jgi:hypothetical protein
VLATACNGEGEGEHMRTELAEIVQALSGVDHKAQSIKTNGSKGNSTLTVKREKQQHSEKSNKSTCGSLCPCHLLCKLPLLFVGADQGQNFQHA